MKGEIETITWICPKCKKQNENSSKSCYYCQYTKQEDYTSKWVRRRKHAVWKEKQQAMRKLLRKLKK